MAERTVDGGRWWRTGFCVLGRTIHEFAEKSNLWKE